jgi:hypothetical protein
MDDFGADLCNVVNPIFNDLSFKVKVLMYEAFLRVETTK